jgi:lipid-A-disaccharide synthase
MNEADGLTPQGTGRIFISAGDISGDIHAAGLIACCRIVDPGIAWTGLGGPRMRAAGCRLLVEPEADPVIGFRRVVARIPYYMGLLARIHHHLDHTRPDLVVLVDYPGLNLQIARLARCLGIPVLYFICPQYWGWAPWRIKRFAKLVDRALVIFPFEEEYFSSHGIQTVHVGHPVFDRVENDAAGGAGKAPPSDELKTLALLPGSRIHEVRTNLPVMLHATARLLEENAGLVPIVVHERPECLALAERMAMAEGISLRTVEGKIDEAARSARLCLVASGTATLEVALTGTPMVVVYRVPPALRKLSRWLLTVPWFCQVNLIAGEETVPEFLLSKDDPAPLLPACRALLEETPERAETLRRLVEFRKKHFKPGALERAAREVAAFAVRQT